MLSWIDYLVLIIPLAFVYFMAFYCRRYIRSVVDFIAAGRLCGRYVMSVAGVATSLSVIGIVAYVEVHYKTGFALGFWQSLVLPISVVMGLTGFFSYRFRETKAMSVGQFLEMRYSRKFRIFAAGLRSLSEMLANMIMPAIAARFFIYALDLPGHFKVCGIEFNTFGTLIIVSLIMAISIIWISGDLGITVTDTLQGLLFYPLLVTFVVFCLTQFDWFQEISPVMADRVPGESFLDPYDMRELRDFNFFFLGVTIFGTILQRGSWVTGEGSRARSPHEQKMAGLLGDWRSALNILFYVLVAIVILTVMNHVNYADKSKAIRADLSTQVARQISPTDEIRENLISAVNNIPKHNHITGKDTPLSEKNNLDTPYLDTAKEELKNAPDNQGSKLYQQFRTLYHQMMMAVSIRHILPPGMLGLFLLMMIMAMVSTDDTRIYSAATTIAQDVVLPLRKKPFTPEGHMMMIRWVSVGIGIFFFFGSFFMAQLDYINLFVTLMCTMWLGGCGPVMIFGLYSRFGNTYGAWSSLLTGMFLGFNSIFLQRKWADLIYPYLERHGLVESVGNFLTAVSKPFNPYIVWEMNPAKCPINSYELYFMTMVITLALYCLISYLTNIGKEKFNLDRMLHRGIYAINGEKKIKTGWSFKGVISKLVGITPEYTTGDKWIAWGLFSYSIVYKFILIFVVVLIIRPFVPLSMKFWSNYFLVTYMIIPGIVAALTTVWFAVGGINDLRQLFRDLKARSEVNILDDGRVEGNVSLADKKAFEEIEERQKK
ncbi:MAG: sodium:panthothenate symporter [Lentisphaerae bacterium]|nr:sodium:panthothenate symporter [Lentisphaerota bacterium]